ncbi:MAG: hypothetical protein JO243_15855 [Solirubrobacterales bacterium]|nr:hypothetical protein [Solirubrobacterales bacterium]
MIVFTVGHSTRTSEELLALLALKRFGGAAIAAWSRMPSSCAVGEWSISALANGRSRTY